ncbi:hydroxyacid dehydrogenase [Georgenia halophila]|uniref:Hydroxyacid dehydrogenase n=1 Tax=Georgenia halophila TaxID=620889 RepID=A0ABP8L335_9MICO
MIQYAIAVGSSRLAEQLFGSSYEVLEDVAAQRIGGVLTEFESDMSRRVLAHVEVLFTGWETPALSASVLRFAPRLRRVIHAGGAADRLFPDGNGDVVCSDMGSVNAIPVAEYTLAMIILSNKDTFRARELYRTRRSFIDREQEFPHAGNHARTIGVISASRTGRALVELLHSFPSLRTLVYDPHLPPHEARSLGVERVDLPELMRSSDVVTVHAPVLPETTGLIDAEMLAYMSDGATLINTARGAIVDQAALETELQTGRINAVLDVTDPEPLPSTSKLYDLPNVFLTPHIAGSMGTELRRMGDEAARELSRYVEPPTEAAPATDR